MLLLLLACAGPAKAPAAGGDDPGDLDETGHEADTGGDSAADSDSDPCDSGMVGYADVDGDGYGDADVPLTGCDTGAVAQGADDCDDADGGVFPGAPETCDGRDEDCDGLTDEDLAAAWYADDDGDGHGDPASATAACTQPSGTVATDDDCDDTEPLAWTGATEVCGDGVDNDCDGQGCLRTGEVDLEDALVVHTGVATWDYAGLGVAPAGDWDGDGLDDLFVGAPLTDSTGRDAGTVYVATASAGGSLSGALASADGPHADADFGQSVAAVGDLTGDGRIDLVAGGPSVLTETEFAPGVAVLYDGATRGELDVHTTYLGVVNYEQLGSASAALDDLDGDGVPDFLLGAQTHGYLDSTRTGAVYVVYAAPGGEVDVTDAAWRVTGPSGAYAGAALADVGDVDGDGIDDALIGSLGTGSVAAWLVTGGWGDVDLDDIATTRLLAESATDSAGSAVASAGDVDGDGLADLVVGGYSEATNGTYAGAAWLVLGSRTGDVDLATADAKVLGEHASAFAGISVGGTWDLDGDGHDELIVGARQDSGRGSNAGAVFILPGSTRGTVDTSVFLTKIRGPAGALAGQRVGRAGDVDGDGADDLWISATGYDGYRGGVFLFGLVDL